MENKFFKELTNKFDIKNNKKELLSLFNLLDEMVEKNKEFNTHMFCSLTKFNELNNALKTSSKNIKNLNNETKNICDEFVNMQSVIHSKTTEHNIYIFNFIKNINELKEKNEFYIYNKIQEYENLLETLLTKSNILLSENTTTENRNILEKNNFADSENSIDFDEYHNTKKIENWLDENKKTEELDELKKLIPKIKRKINNLTNCILDKYF